MGAVWTPDFVHEAMAHVLVQAPKLGVLNTLNFVLNPSFCVVKYLDSMFEPDIESQTLCLCKTPSFVSEPGLHSNTQCLCNTLNFVMEPKLCSKP